MDKNETRAASLALSLYFFKAVPVKLSDIFHLSERFFDYIWFGIWPKEAIEQLGKQEAESGIQSSGEAEGSG